MSHAMLLDTLDTGAVWSVARGLARSEAIYKQLLANCDRPRRNDLDGHGNLSEEALAEFTRFFLTVSIDQVTFMETLMQPDRLRTRILLWAEEESRLGKLPSKSGNILEAVLYRGELPRQDVDTVVGTGERQARRLVSSLLERGVLASDSTRAPLRLTFPAALAHRWMPGLFPEQLG
jgi:Fic family protein